MEFHDLEDHLSNFINVELLFSKYLEHSTHFWAEKFRRSFFLPFTPQSGSYHTEFLLCSL